MPPSDHFLSGDFYSLKLAKMTLCSPIIIKTKIVLIRQTDELRS